MFVPLIRVSLGVIFSLAAFAQFQDAAVVQYSFEEITLSFRPYAMNNRGWIVGCTDSPQRPWRYRPGVGNEQISDSRGCLDDINDAGTAVGWLVDLAGTVEGIIRPAGQPWKRIGTFGGGSSTLTAINEAGQAAGSYDKSPTRSGQYRAIIYTEAAGKTDLTDTYSHASAINEAGQVTGGTSADGFLWDIVGGFLHLQPLIGPGAGYLQYARGTGISDDGTVMLLQDTISTYSVAEGFRHVGRFGTRTIPKAINDRGWIVGDAYDRETSVASAVLYVRGQGVRDLNILTPGLPIRVSEAVDINDRDQILARAYDGVAMRHFLLTRIR